jgi:phosphoribosylformylglycinamidine synthase subunit PurS
MNVRVRVRPRPGVLDPEGRAVQAALRDLGYEDLADVRTGKIFELDIATSDPARARALAREMCDKLLANPVIEQYEIDLLESERG